MRSDGSTMLWHEAEAVRETLSEIPPLYLKEMFRAFLAVNRSLTETIGPDWLDKSSGQNIPYDIRSVLLGNLKADERGVLRSTL